MILQFFSCIKQSFLQQVIYLNLERLPRKNEFTIKIAESGPVVCACRAQLDRLIVFYRIYS